MTQRVLITGAGDGIGLGIAGEFLKTGATVFICDVRGELFDEEMRRTFAGCYRTDVGSTDDVASMFEDIRSKADGLDVLINNVGIAGPHAGVEDIDLADWEATLRVNLTGAFLCIKEAVPHMKAQGGGAIINISSVGTLTVPPMRSVYNTSKWAIEGLTKSLARELGPFGISCNAILPGIMNNNRMRGIMERRSKHENRDVDDIAGDYLKYSAMGRLIEVEEIGHAAVFLASDKARGITSQFLSVCGGTAYED